MQVPNSTYGSVSVLYSRQAPSSPHVVDHKMHWESNTLPKYIGAGINAEINEKKQHMSKDKTAALFSQIAL